LSLQFKLQLAQPLYLQSTTVPSTTTFHTQVVLPRFEESRPTLQGLLFAVITSQLCSLTFRFGFRIAPFEPKTEEQYRFQSPPSFFRSYLPILR